jgi:hypothetical protein
MTWLSALVKGLLGAFIGWAQKQAEKPKTTEDANTPKDVRNDLNTALDDWMRNKDNSGH